MEQLLIYKIIYLSTTWISIIFVLFILTKTKREKFNIVYALMNTAAALWALGRYSLIVAPSHDIALIFARLMHFGSIFVHVLFLHSILVFLSKDKSRKTWLQIFYANAILTACFNFYDILTGSGLFVVDVVPKLVFPWVEVGGPLYNLHLINEVLIPFLAFSEMVIAYFQLSGVKRDQIKYIIVSSFFGFVGGNTVIFLIYDIPIMPVGVWLVPLNFLAMTYAIFRYKLMDFKTVAAEFFILGLTTVTFIELILSTSVTEITWRTVFLLMVCFLSYLSIKSVYGEQNQRIKIEKLAEDLEFANAKLTELDQLKTEFISLTTHQLRGPLAAIKGYASEILEGDFGKVPVHLIEPINTIYRSCQSLVMIVEDFLNISRIEQGRMKYDMTVFSLGELVEEVMNENKPSFQRKKLSTYVTVDKGPKIRADKGKIKQILNNLIDNSIKYTQEGEVTVGVTQVGNKVVFSIKDTGVGISKETMPKLFQKYMRASDASRANILGTGLGLYIASQMVKAHGGRLWAESAGVGRGSAFFVELDAVNEPLTEAAPATKLSSGFLNQLNSTT